METETWNTMQWVCVADLQNEGIHPRFCNEKGSSVDRLRGRERRVANNGWQEGEREAVLTEMGRERGREAGRKGLARRQGWPRGDKKGRRRPPWQGRMNG